jgi:phosphoribosyl-ATP pyrophosphohydrolase/phosphoribosyl-AMP cyclohydrolase
MFDLSQLDFSQDSGFVTVVAQDAKTGDVLMVARADRESIVQTLATGDLQFHTRLSGRWRPNTGSRQRVVSLECDCDGDALLARVAPAGPVCHTGASSCFTHPESDQIDAPVERRGSGSAAARRRLRKLGEEAALAITACSAEDLAAASEEVASLVHRALVALCAAGGTLSDVQLLLGRRTAPTSGPTRNRAPNA